MTMTVEGRDPAARFTRRFVLTFSLGSLIVFGLLAWLLAAVTHRPFPPSLGGRQAVAVQLVVGLLSGGSVSTAFIVIFLAAPALGGARALARRIFERARLPTSDLLVFAIVAGVGEETLFRGTVQPLLGLWGTSFVFALLHSRLPRSRGRAVYALFVFAAAAGLGILYVHSGLAAAISAHAVADLVFLLWARRALAGRKTGRATPIGGAVVP